MPNPNVKFVGVRLPLDTIEKIVRLQEYYTGQVGRTNVPRGEVISKGIDQLYSLMLEESKLQETTQNDSVK